MREALNSFLQVSLEALEVADELSVFVSDGIDIISLVPHIDTKKNFVAVILQFLNGHGDFLSAHVIMAVKEGFADEIAISAAVVVKMLCLKVHVADDVVCIHEHDGVWDRVKNISLNFMQFHHSASFGSVVSLSKAFITVKIL